MQLETLTPASLISMLLSGFPSSQSTDPDMQMGAYLIAIEGTSLKAVYHAVKAYLQRRVKRASHEFAPSSADFAEQCRYQEAAIKAEAAPRIEAQPEPDRGPPVSPEKLKLLQRTLRGDRSAAAQLAAIYPHLDIVAPEQEQQP